MSAEDKEKWDRRYHEGAYADRTAPAVWLAESLPAIKASLAARSSTTNRFRALDLACGAGRNGWFLVREGFCVDGVDISPVGLTRARQTPVDTIGDRTAGPPAMPPAIFVGNGKTGNGSADDSGSHGGTQSDCRIERTHGNAGQANSTNDGDQIRFVEHDLDLPLAPVLEDARYDLIVVMRYLNPRLFAELPHLLRPGGEVIIEVHLKTSETVNGPSSDRFRVAPGALAEQMHAAGLETLVALEGLVVDPDEKRMAVARYRGRRRTAEDAHLRIE